MKFKLATALVFAVACAGTAFCDTLTFTSNPSGDVGHSHTYTSGALSVTAYAFSTGGQSLHLFGKTGGGSETGVGIADSDHDNEITTSDFIELDLSSITNPFSLAIGSTQNVEGFQICFSNSLGTLGGDGCRTFDAPLGDPAIENFTKFTGDRYLTITADDNPEAGNVLLDSLTTTATPEPNSLFLFGTGIIAAAGVIRRKLTA